MKMEKRENRRKRRLKTDFWMAADRVFVSLALGVLLLMILVQTVMAVLPGTAAYLSLAVRMEGKSLNMEELISAAGNVSAAPWAALSLKLTDYVSLPDVKVFVDGNETGQFLHHEMTINVKHGSIVSVYNPAASRPVTVIISRKTPNIREPQLMSGVSGSGTLYFEPVVIGN